VIPKEAGGIHVLPTEEPKPKPKPKTIPKPTPTPKRGDWRELGVPEARPRIVRVGEEGYYVEYGGYQKRFSTLPAAQEQSRRLYEQAKRGLRAGYGPETQARRMQAWITQRGGVTPRQIQRRYGLILGEVPSGYVISGVTYGKEAFMLELRGLALPPTNIVGVPSSRALVTKLTGLESYVAERQQRAQPFFTKTQETFLLGGMAPSKREPLTFVPSGFYTYGVPKMKGTYVSREYLRAAEKATREPLLMEKILREGYGYRVTLAEAKKLGIPKGSVITTVERTTEGYRFSYLSKKDWEALPAYVREKREPTFWEIPLHKHMETWLEKHVKWETEGLRIDITTRGVEVSKPDILKPLREQLLAFTAFVKIPEATIGMGEALAGHPSIRSYISTAGGALTSTAISAISPLWGGEGFTTEYLETYRESIKGHPQVLGGELVFELVSGYALGKAISKAWGGLKKLPVPTSVKKTTIGEAIKFSRAMKAYKAAKLKLKSYLPLELWGYREKGWSWGEVAIKGERPSLPVGFGFGKEQAMLVVTHPETYGEYMARTLIWKLHQAPRMGGVILYKALGPALPKTKALPHLISVGGKVSIGYLGELAFEKSEIQLATRARANLLRMDRQFAELTPFVSQRLVTRMGLHPWVPTYIGGKKTFAPLVGLVTPQLMKLPTEPAVATKEIQRITSAVVQKPKRKTREIVTPKIELLDYTAYKEKLKQAGIEKPKAKKKQALVPKTFLAEAAVPRIGEAEIVTQKEKQKQLQKLMLIQKLVTIQPTPEPTPTPYPTPTPIPPLYGKERRRGLSLAKYEELLFGGWYKKRHPIARPQDIVGLIGGPKARKKYVRTERQLKSLGKGLKGLSQLVSGPRKRKRRKRRKR
jgi:hypothetical protein